MLAHNVTDKHPRPLSYTKRISRGDLLMTFRMLAQNVTDKCRNPPVIPKQLEETYNNKKSVSYCSLSIPPLLTFTIDRKCKKKTN